MASRRSSSRRRRRRQRSHLPGILFAAVVATVAGYMIVRASDEGSQGNAPTIGVETSDPDTPNGTTGESTGDPDSSEPTAVDSGADTTDASNLGKPIPIFSDALGDLVIDQVIDDWTPVDRPRLPDKTTEIDPSRVKNGRISGNLPDGYYWGIPVSTFDEDERGINFDIRQVFWGDACFERFGVGDDTCLNDYQVVATSASQLYPSYLSDLLFVSLAVYATGPQGGSEQNMAVVPATFWSLLAAGQPVTVTVPNGDPEPPNVALADSPFLLTIVDGAIIAAEGVWIP